MKCVLTVLRLVSHLVLDILDVIGARMKRSALKEASHVIFAAMSTVLANAMPCLIVRGVQRLNHASQRKPFVQNALCTQIKKAAREIRHIIAHIVGLSRFVRKRAVWWLLVQNVTCSLSRHVGLFLAVSGATFAA